LAGANLIYGLGMLEAGVTFDYGQLVMDNEFAKMIKHAVGGIQVNAETLAVEVIGKVGPFQQFMSEDHTFTHMRAMSQPSLIDRTVRQNWEAEGGRSMHEKALEKAREIMDTHQPPPLPDATLKTMSDIVAEVEEELGVARK
jgi:trimethylamine--corrinoid protein Co-methyltransferase